MLTQPVSDNCEPTLDAVEILESYVPDSRVHEFIDNPTDAVIAEGRVAYAIRAANQARRVLLRDARTRRWRGLGQWGRTSLSL